MNLEQIIRQHMIVWPLNVDSQLWNDRLESLIEVLTGDNNENDEKKS